MAANSVWVDVACLSPAPAPADMKSDFPVAHQHRSGLFMGSRAGRQGLIWGRVGVERGSQAGL